MPVEFRLNGSEVSVPEAVSLLDALRDELGVVSVKDGCSPQGQCGCCTVLVDGSPRVACVTPVARVRGRDVVTVEGLDDADRWGRAFCEAGASQCGFCTPGIVLRLSALAPEELTDRASIDRALLAHLCRCTGWQTIRAACAIVASGERTASTSEIDLRDHDAAARRAGLEGRSAQAVSVDVVVGRGGFADDVAPRESLVAVLDPEGEWVVGASVAEARARAGKIQGRRTTAPPSWPIELPPGGWDRTLRTTWVEPAYLEPDASWCEPGGEPASPLGNGGAFGGKAGSEVATVARRLADERGRPVRVVMSREDTVRRGPKRPPIAIGVRGDRTGVVRIARPTTNEQALADSIARVAPGVDVEFLDVAGPPVSSDLRAAGWAEVAAVLGSLGDGPDRVSSPDGSSAVAEIDPDGSVRVEVECGAVLDEVVLRSYCIGATHMALGMVRSEAIAVTADGEPLDLTIRSFGILRAVDTPAIDVAIRSGTGPPINGSDAVFAAVFAAAWRHAGFPAVLPSSADPAP